MGLFEMSRYYESIDQEEIIPPGGDWIVEFQYTDYYIRTRVQSPGWHCLKESWWVDKDAKAREKYRYLEMKPRELEPLLGSRVARVMAEAIRCNDVATWRFRNIETGEAIPGDICVADRKD